MSEPGSVASPQPHSEKAGLWNEAPGWRNLTVAAAVLTASAIALPLIPAQPEACRLALPTVPGTSYRGTVLSFVDGAASMNQINRIQRKSGGRIDPVYTDRQRVSARGNDGNLNFFSVPPNLEVHIGDQLLLQNWFRNANLPCNYVPNLVIANLGPAGDSTKAPPGERN